MKLQAIALLSDFIPTMYKEVGFTQKHSYDV